MAVTFLLLCFTGLLVLHENDDTSFLTRKIFSIFQVAVVGRFLSITPLFLYHFLHFLLDI